MLHVQHLAFVEHAIQVCSFDVNLVQLKTQIVYHCDNGMRGCKMGHRCVCVIIVDASDLAETLGYQTCFVPGDIAHSVLLCLEDPLGTDYICMSWCFFKSPGSSCLQHYQLLLDGFFPQQPIWLALCLSEHLRL